MINRFGAITITLLMVYPVVIGCVQNDFVSFPNVENTDSSYDAGIVAENSEPSTDLDSQVDSNSDIAFDAIAENIQDAGNTFDSHDAGTDADANTSDVESSVQLDASPENEFDAAIDANVEDTIDVVDTGNIEDTVDVVDTGLTCTTFVSCSKFATQ